MYIRKYNQRVQPLIVIPKTETTISKSVGHPKVGLWIFALHYYLLFMNLNYQNILIILNKSQYPIHFG